MATQHKFALLLGAALVGGSLSHSASAACTIYFSNTATYSIAQNSVAYPHSFTTTCSPGVITGSFTSLAGQANLEYKLEKLSAGSWTTVATGSSFSYTGGAANYRYVVKNTGGSGNYTFTYRHP